MSSVRSVVSSGTSLDHGVFACGGEGEELRKSTAGRNVRGAKRSDGDVFVGAKNQLTEIDEELVLLARREEALLRSFETEEQECFLK